MKKQPIPLFKTIQSVAQEDQEVTADVWHCASFLEGSFHIRSSDWQIPYTYQFKLSFVSMTNNCEFLETKTKQVN